ncbi:unnamed protein product [Protopolystoma xenopodis]|uniref:Uncharacterized protein n=1 Tax=Protopolystoma xenopodis TaxID=117903 RepID=A0A3S5AH51_9PLAT|nr:unnamed protein product [Protopolystoma xenopodis]
MSLIRLHCISPPGCSNLTRDFAISAIHKPASDLSTYLAHPSMLSPSHGSAPGLLREHLHTIIATGSGVHDGRLVRSSETGTQVSPISESSLSRLETVKGLSDDPTGRTFDANVGRGVRARSGDDDDRLAVVRLEGLQCNFLYQATVSGFTSAGEGPTSIASEPFRIGIDGELAGFGINI